MLASEDPEVGGLGADPGVTVVRAAAAGVHACCLLSDNRLRLMALEEGDAQEAELLPVDADEGKTVGVVGGAFAAGEGGAGEAWEAVEAVCMFGVQVGG